jgi:O-antigen ligase
MIRENPFLGKGIGTFMDHFARYTNIYPAYAHNCYLQIWAESGIFSLLSFIIFIGAVLYSGIKKFLATKDFLLLGFISGLMGFLAHTLFDVDLYSLRLAMLFWVWVGLISARIVQKEE